MSWTASGSPVVAVVSRHLCSASAFDSRPWALAQLSRPTDGVACPGVAPAQMACVLEYLWGRWALGTYLSAALPRTVLVPARPLLWTEVQTLRIHSFSVPSVLLS